MVWVLDEGVDEEGGGAYEEPVEVGLEVAGVEGAGAKADEADEASRAAGEEAGDEEVVEEGDEAGEGLLDAGDVGGVELVGEFLEAGEDEVEEGEAELERILWEAWVLGLGSWVFDWGWRQGAAVSLGGVNAAAATGLGGCAVGRRDAAPPIFGAWVLGLES